MKRVRLNAEVAAGEERSCACEGVIDRSVLNSLAVAQTPGMPDLIVELIDLYLDDAPLRLAAIKTALDSRDENGLRDSAHALRGSSSTLGVGGIALRCGQLEQSNPCDSAGVRALFEILQQEFTHVRAAMLREREKRSHIQS
jgi:HPt (histidine-containing phosphotransfer) domain-containing protein